MSNSEANKRIAKNTMLLYIRMGVMMIISFFTARITLEALGVVDYGINNVVGGLVSMFSLISSSLSSSVSRFMTFGLGKGDKKELNTIFSTSVNIHIILAIIVVIAIETIGLWFLNNKMVIPADRLTAAHWVLQCSTFLFVLGLLSVPYNAAIIAHERMDVYAYFTLFDAFSRLAIIFAIKYYGGDKLILLAIISMIPPLIKQLYYWHYSKKNFEECTYHAVWGYSCILSTYKYSPDAMSTLTALISGAVMTAALALTVIFLAFFIYVCSLKALSATASEVAIMRSMGIPSAVIKIGMYARMALCFVPGALAALGVGALVGLVPAVNKIFSYLYLWQYLPVLVCIFAISARVTSRQMVKIFNQSVKTTLRGGDKA